MRGCRPLTDEEVMQIFEAFDTKTIFGKRNQAIFAIGIETGYRIGELLKLKVKDVWKNNIVVKHITLQQTKSKNIEYRKKRLSGSRDLIRDWLKELCTWLEIEKPHPDLYLFQSYKGANKPIRYNQIRVAMFDAATKAGIAESNGTLSTHSMRKTYAHRIYAYYEKQYHEHKTAQNPLVLTQLALGHKNINNTLKYLSFLSDQVPDEEITFNRMKI